MQGRDEERGSQGGLKGGQKGQEEQVGVNSGYCQANGDQGDLASIMCENIGKFEFADDSICRNQF